MNALLRNGSNDTFQSVAVNYACAEDYKLYIQDMLGDWYCITGFWVSGEAFHCLRDLCRTGFYDFTEKYAEPYNRNGGGV